MEENKKYNRVYGISLLIYTFFLFISISFWISELDGTGGESLGHMCITMPLALVMIIYLISAVLVFNEKYSKAVPFTLFGFVLLLFPLFGAMSWLRNTLIEILAFIFYLIVPFALFLLIASVDDKIKRNQDISKTYFPPPPATP